jgi:hypothetical protein
VSKRKGGGTMSTEELKRTLEVMERVRKELAGSKERSLAFLVEAGILFPDGTPVISEGRER